MEKLSQPIERFDVKDKIAGEAKYCADLHPDGLIYARTLRATLARARILSISLPELPPDYVIVDHRDISGRNVVPIVFEDQPFFAEQEVKYIGEPILLVAGPDKAVILEILAKITVNYEALDPILTLEQAEQRTEDFISGDKPYFVSYSYDKGDPETAIAEAASVVEDEFRSAYQEHAYLETQAMLAEYKENVVSVYGSMQCPYYIIDALKMALGWEESRLRVVQLPTGGGFGGKEEYPSIPGVHAALAAIKTGKPVQLVFDRQEDIAVTTKRHPSIIRLKSYLDSNGRIIARDVDVALDAGAYAGLSSVVLQRSIFSVCGVYNVENLRVSGRAYATNNVVTGAFRGFGGPQAFFAIEMHMETIAARLQVDALALRKQYYLHQGDTSSTGGLFHSPLKLDEITARIADDSDYYEKRRRFAEDKQTLKGIGFSIVFHGCGFTGAGEAEMLKPRIRLAKNRDNSVEIFVSSTELGQGVLTTLRKIVAEVLAIPPERVHHNYPDTAVCPNSGPTVASRTILIVGRMLQDCALEMKARWSEPEFELIRDYQYPPQLAWDNANFRGHAYPDYAWGANVVEVEIDPMTFEIAVTGVWGIYDIGTPIDVKIIQGQIEGGLTQGLGHAAMEVLEAKDGRLRQTTLTTYAIPTARDFPRIHAELIENSGSIGPFGAKGLGELPLVGAAPALAAAVQNALGKRIRKIPVTPEAIMELMRYEN